MLFRQPNHRDIWVMKWVMNSAFCGSGWQRVITSSITWFFDYLLEQFLLPC